MCFHFHTKRLKSGKSASQKSSTAAPSTTKTSKEEPPRLHISLQGSSTTFSVPFEAISKIPTYVFLNLVPQPSAAEKAAAAATKPAEVKDSFCSKESLKPGPPSETLAAQSEELIESHRVLRRLLSEIENVVPTRSSSSGSSRRSRGSARRADRDRDRSADSSHEREQGRERERERERERQRRSEWELELQRELRERQHELLAVVAKQALEREVNSEAQMRELKREREERDMDRRIEKEVQVQMQRSSRVWNAPRHWPVMANDALGGRSGYHDERFVKMGAGLGLGMGLGLSDAINRISRGGNGNGSRYPTRTGSDPSGGGLGADPYYQPAASLYTPTRGGRVYAYHDNDAYDSTGYDRDRAGAFIPEAVHFHDHRHKHSHLHSWSNDPSAREAQFAASRAVEDDFQDRDRDRRRRESSVVSIPAEWIRENVRRGSLWRRGGDDWVNARRRKVEFDF
jgi:hypothetical protein